MPRVKVSRVTAGYGIDSAIVYFQREEQSIPIAINDLRWLAPPSRLEMQLLEQEASSCFAKSAGAICEAPIGDETGRGSDQKQIRFLSVDEVLLMREGIAAVINAKPDMQAISTKS